MSIDVYAVGILSALKYRRAGWLRREFRNLKRRISDVGATIGITGAAE